MKTSLSKRALNRQRWCERIDAWKSSGQSQKAFCQKHHLRLSSFQRWCRIFKAQETSTDPAAVNFLPVRVKQTHASHLSVWIKDDLRIDIPAEFDPHALRQLIQVLRRS